MKDSISGITIVVIFSGLLFVLPKFAMAQGVIAFDDQLDRYWVAKKVAPIYPSEALRRGTMGCAAVGFIIKSDGSTGDHKVLAFDPSNVFNKSAITAAKKFKYQPAEQNPDKTPALTFNVFTYQINVDKKTDEKNRKKLKDICSTMAKKVLEPLTGSSDTS